MARRRNNEYKPTFEVSGYGRPVSQRLTPLAYICIAIAGFFVVLGIVVLIGNSTGYSSSELARRLGLAREQKPTSEAQVTVTAPVVLERAVVANVSSASTATPAPVKPRTPTPVRPTSTPRPTRVVQARPTTVALVEPTRGPAPTDEPSGVTPDSNGELMAPQTVVERTQRDVLAYFDALSNHKSPQNALKDLVEERDVFLGKYFEGEALRTIKASVGQDKLNVLKEGTTNVRVVRYTKDGSMATVAISKRGWIVQSYDRATLTDPVEVKLKDEDLLWLVRYSSNEQRWKVMNVSSLPTGRRVFSEEGRKSFEAFVKEMTKNQPTATPVP
jgi:hypothetical protein